MTPEDVDAVFDIELAVQAYPWTRTNFKDALSQGYVCRVDSEDRSAVLPEDRFEIRGYAILLPAVDEAELLNIGVAAIWQRKGLGSLIMNEMLQEAREMNMRRVLLEVRPSNIAAIALYKRSGFDLIGVRRGYYHNANSSEDALVMACNLKDEVNG